MPRTPRIAFPGAYYHIINRGINRAGLFANPGAARDFHSCLLEACDRMGWVLLAYAILRNRFELAIETPRPNLVQGMHWLETAFAVRVSRRRRLASRRPSPRRASGWHVGEGRERGPVFQGRYIARLVQPGAWLARVVNHVHLGPVRAGLAAPGRLSEYRRCSLRDFTRRGRPRCLACASWIGLLGLADSPAGWRAYRTLLGWLASDAAKDSELGRGWAIGSTEWKKQVKAASRRRLGCDPEEWMDMLESLLKRSRRSAADARAAKKGAPWKVKLALKLRRTTSATNGWIARHLAMGTAGSLSVHLSRERALRT